MINLLPAKEKKELLIIKNRRLFIVLLCIFAISLLCFALMLLSMYFYLLAQISYQKDILGDAKTKYQTADFLYYRDLIFQYDASLIKINNFYKKEVYFSSALKTISAIGKPAALHLQNIALENNSAHGNIKVTISGLSDTRENLVIFKNNIESNKEITNSYFPPDDWIKSKDVNFYATFEVSGTK